MSFRSVASAVLSRLLLVVVIAAIVVPIVAFVLSQSGGDSTENDNTTTATCFPAVTQRAAPVVQSLIAQNMSQSDLQALLTLISTTNFSHPGAAPQAIGRVVELGFLTPIVAALNLTNLGDLYARLPSFIGLFQSPGPLFCYEDAVADNDRGCCYFSCSEWDWYTKAEMDAATGLLYAGFVLGVIMMVIIIIVLVKRPDERKFPSVIPYFMMSIHFVISLIMCIVRWVGKDSAFCCNKNFLNAVGERACGGTYAQTLFEQYGGLSLAFWLASAVFNVWYASIFPHKVTKESTLKLLVIESIFAWILPAFLVGIQFATKGDETFRLQPFCHECMGVDEQLLYYFYVLEIQIATAVSGIFLSWVLYSKYRKSKEEEEEKEEKEEKEEEDISQRKLVDHQQLTFLTGQYIHYAAAMFFALCWNLLVYSLFTFGSDDISNAVREYFRCAAYAFSPTGSCIKSGEAEYSTVLVLLLWPLNVFGSAIIALIYLFSLRRIRDVLKNLFVSSD